MEPSTAWEPGLESRKRLPELARPLTQGSQGSRGHGTSRMGKLSQREFRSGGWESQGRPEGRNGDADIWLTGVGGVLREGPRPDAPPRLERSPQPHPQGPFPSQPHLHIQPLSVASTAPVGITAAPFPWGLGHFLPCPPPLSTLSPMS